jgi:membrane protein involved in colicin uptake
MRRWSWKSWTELGSGIAVVAALGVTALITGPLPTATPSPTAAVPHAASCPTYRGGECVTDEQQTEAFAAEQKLADDQAAQAKAAADAAAAQAAADVAAQQAAQRSAQQKSAASDPSGGGLPAGAVVPSIPGTTSPDTSKCASGTASDNASGVAICD